MADRNTIRGQIESLARLTRAPEPFVREVRSLFLNKGFSLEEQAGPYIRALEEAFRREEMIRRSTGRAQERLHSLQNRFDRLSDAYRRQLDRLDQLRRSEGDYAPRYSRAAEAKPKAEPKKKKKPRLLIASDRPAVVTKTQSDTPSLVPGPDDVQ